MLQMSLTLLYQFEPESWIKLINIRYTIPMSDFQMNCVSLTDLSLVPNESQEGSLSY